MGDPTPIGWATTALYFVACFVCASNLSRVPRSSQPGSNQLERRGWWLLTAATLLLGLNKQLDLQFWLTIHGKELLRELDLYSHRRLVQVGVFVTAVLAISVIGLFSFPLWRAGSRRLKIALGGLALVFSYVLMRAALFQKVALLGSHSLVPWLELVGPLIIISTDWRISSRLAHHQPSQQQRLGQANPQRTVRKSR